MAKSAGMMAIVADSPTVMEQHQARYSGDCWNSGDSGLIPHKCDGRIMAYPENLTRSCHILMLEYHFMLNGFEWTATENARHITIKKRCSRFLSLLSQRHTRHMYVFRT